MTRARWALGAAAAVIVIVLAWGWVQRNGRLRAEGVAEADHRLTAEAVARADSVEKVRTSQEVQFIADTAQSNKDKRAALVLAASAGRAQREATERANQAAAAVETATHDVLAAAGRDSATVTQRLEVLIDAHRREVGELRSALASADQRGSALERAVTAADSSLAATGRQLEEERTGRLAERAAKDAALAEAQALRDARPGFFEKALRVVVPVVAFVGGVWVGAQAGG